MRVGNSERRRPSRCTPGILASVVARWVSNYRRVASSRAGEAQGTEARNQLECAPGWSKHTCTLDSNRTILHSAICTQCLSTPHGAARLSQRRLYGVDCRPALSSHRYPLSQSTHVCHAMSPSQASRATFPTGSGSRLGVGACLRWEHATACLGTTLLCRGGCGSLVQE